MQIGLSQLKLGASTGVGPSLAFDFLAGSLDSKVTFTRASNATYFNSAGTLTTAGNDVARFDYDPSTLAARGLLIEEQRTNYLVRSADYSATWSTSPLASITVTQPGGQTAPDGTQAWKYATNDTASSAHTLFQAWTGGIINTGYCFSVYLKAAEYPRASVWLGNTAFASTTYGGLFDLSNGTIVTTAGGSTVRIENAGNGWYRCSVTATSDADGGNYVAAINFHPATVSTVSGTYTPASTGLGGWVWGAQVEIGDFPTSYIPTTTASATRNADTATVSTLTPWFNATEGTLLAQFTFFSPAVGEKTAVALDDNTTNDNIRLRTFATDAKFTVTDGGVSQADITAGTVASNTTYRIAGAYKVNDFAASLNGGTVQTDTGGTVPTVDRLRLGTNQAGLILNGHLGRVVFYPRRLSNAELQAITV